MTLTVWRCEDTGELGRSVTGGNRIDRSIDRSVDHDLHAIWRLVLVAARVAQHSRSVASLQSGTEG